MLEREEAGPSAQRALVERIHAGSTDAESELWTTYARGLRFIIRRHVANDAQLQDVLQECFRIAIGHLRAGRIENPDALAGFLRGIALNVAAEQRRARARDPQALDDLPGFDAADERPTPPDTTHLDQLRRLVQRLIGELNVSRDRELLWRFYVLEHDKSLLCRELALSAEHFDRVLHRARARFRALAEEAGLGQREREEMR